MKLFVIFGQRKERYPGEYAPEALDCIDDVGQSDNPDFLEGKMAEYTKSNEFESLVVVPLEFSQDALMKMLRPSAAAIPAKIVD